MEPPEFAEFDKLYDAVRTADWNGQEIHGHVKALEAFLAKHPELYKNGDIMAMIRNARGHCDSGQVPYTF